MIDYILNTIRTFYELMAGIMTRTLEFDKEPLEILLTYAEYEMRQKITVKLPLVIKYKVIDECFVAYVCNDSKHKSRDKTAAKAMTWAARDFIKSKFKILYEYRNYTSEHLTPNVQSRIREAKKYVDLEMLRPERTLDYLKYS